MPELTRPFADAADPAAVGARRLALRRDISIVTLREVAGAGLVLVKTCILFAGSSRATSSTTL